jgi:hypothetical protein
LVPGAKRKAPLGFEKLVSWQDSGYDDCRNVIFHQNQVKELEEALVHSIHANRDMSHIVESETTVEPYLLFKNDTCLVCLVIS